LKNILYCCCINDPWVEVAKELHNKKNYRPVYWIGWPEDSKDAINREFPNCIYHDISDAWKGVFPNELRNTFFTQLDGFELSDYSFEELMAIKMMERLDPDQQSFTFNERKDFFRYLLSSWLNILKTHNIELIIAPSIPHRVFDYALYIAADFLNIKFLTFKMTAWPGYVLPIFDIDKLPIIQNKKDLKIDKAANDYVEKVNSSYSDAEPDYMKKQSTESKKSLVVRAFEFLRKNQFSFLLYLFKPTKTYWKKKKKSIQESNYSSIQVLIQKFKGYYFKKQLKKYYESICDLYKKENNYVFVALHYQPEETSCPSGKIYVDQHLMVEALSKYLPEDVLIYVKEHPSQFNPKMEGQTGRNASFYHKLKSIERVKLISTTFNSFELIDNSMVVATLTGTVGVEALIRGKCVAVFGTAWYESLAGVIKIKNVRDLSILYKNIQKHKYCKDEILKGLTNIRAESLIAYHYKGVRENAVIPTNVAVKNLSNYILNLG
jgi:hypothetical protein